ncbi:MAG TPA: ROK family protein [Acidimicrobiales bacterium]|nr:ROK family protein [Acidimicrobiales bacterium]
MRTVGVDVGGTKCLAVALEEGRMIDERRVPTPVGEPAVLEAVAGVVAEVAGTTELRGVGIGMPGFVDRAGVLRFAPNLPGVVDFPIREELEARLGIPVRADNDATCAAWGERQLGAAQGYNDVILVTLGTGIGGGIVAGGSLLRGANGFGGEIGHMVINTDGPPCPCGQRGCWERYASGSGLAGIAQRAAAEGRAPRVLARAGGEPAMVRGEHVTVAAAEGDRGAQDVLAELGWWVAQGLADLANVFDPEAFVLGGGLVEAGDLLLNPVRAAFAELLTGAAYRPPVDILPATLGEHAGAIGAACLFEIPREIGRS